MKSWLFDALNPTAQPLLSGQSCCRIFRDGCGLTLLSSVLSVLNREGHFYVFLAQSRPFLQWYPTSFCTHRKLFRLNFLPIILFLFLFLLLLALFCDMEFVRRGPTVGFLLHVLLLSFEINVDSKWTNFGILYIFVLYLPTQYPMIFTKSCDSATFHFSNLTWEELLGYQ